jgi:hypothetical protein
MCDGKWNLMGRSLRSGDRGKRLETFHGRDARGNNWRKDKPVDMLTFVSNPHGFQVVDAMPKGEMFTVT